MDTLEEKGFRSASDYAEDDGDRLRKCFRLRRDFGLLQDYGGQVGESAGVGRLIANKPAT